MDLRHYQADAVSERKLIKTAISYIGTPFLHQGRLKGPSGGIDCVGLVVGINRECGLSDYDYTTYGIIPNSALLIRHCDQQLERVDNRLRQAATVVLMYLRNPKFPKHIGVITPWRDGNLGIIHVHAHLKKVVHVRFLPEMQARISHVYKFPGVTYDG